MLAFAEGSKVLDNIVEIRTYAEFLRILLKLLMTLCYGFIALYLEFLHDLVVILTMKSDKLEQLLVLIVGPLFLLSLCRF